MKEKRLSDFPTVAHLFASLLLLTNYTVIASVSDDLVAYEHNVEITPREMARFARTYS